MDETDVLGELVIAELDDETVCAVEEFAKPEVNDDWRLEDDVEPSLVCEVDDAGAMLDEVAVKIGPMSTLEETTAVRLNEEEFELRLVAELLEVVVTEVFANNAPSETLDESALVRSSALEELAEE